MNSEFSIHRPLITLSPIISIAPALISAELLKNIVSFIINVEFLEKIPADELDARLLAILLLRISTEHSLALKAHPIAHYKSSNLEFVI